MERKSVGNKYVTSPSEFTLRSAPVRPLKVVRACERAVIERGYEERSEGDDVRIYVKLEEHYVHRS